MSTVEAAKMLCVSVATIKRWLEEGVIYGVKVGTTWVTSDAAIKEALRIGAVRQQYSKRLERW